jgi:hypothetical protein
LKHVECGVPVLFGLDPYEMIGEKIMACNRRGIRGSSKDVYDLYLWSQRPFDDRLARRLAVLKAWTDQRTKRPYVPQQFLDAIVPRNFRWTDITRLVPRKHGADYEAICSSVRSRFGFLAECDEDEHALITDQSAHRERRLFNELKVQAEEWAAAIPR